MGSGLRKIVTSLEVVRIGSEIQIKIKKVANLVGERLFWIFYDIFSKIRQSFD